MPPRLDARSRCAIRTPLCTPLDGRPYDHLSQYMLEVLHWLPFPQSISYTIASVVFIFIGAFLAWRPPICVSFATRSLVLCRMLNAAVHCPQRFGGPIRPLCDNAEPFLFCG